MNKRKFLSLGWLVLPFLGAWLILPPVYAAVSDNLDSTTSQFRQTYMGPGGETQTLNVSTDNGGTLTVGRGVSTSGFTTNYDSTKKCQVVTVNGITQTTPGVIYSSTGTLAITTTTFQGVLQVSTITAATSNFNGMITLPANYLVSGKTIRYTVVGTLSTPGAASGSDIVFAVKLGTTTIGTTGNVSFPVGLSSMTFLMTGLLNCVAAGTFVAGVSSATTQFIIEVASGTTQSPAGDFYIGNSTNNVAQINTTQANDLNIVVGFKNSSAGYVLSPSSIVYEALN